MVCLYFVFELFTVWRSFQVLWGMPSGSSSSESEGRRLQFVDLGCGNGLLCYILAEEGVSSLPSKEAK